MAEQLTLQPFAVQRDYSARTIRLDTLVRLRWLAVAGQAAAVLVVYFGLGFDLPLTLCLGLIGLSAALNIMLRLRWAASERLGGPEAGPLLAYDILQLGGLLFLTGGLANPFAILLLAPVMVSATTLAWQQTALLGVIVIVVATIITVFHEPLPWTPGAEFQVPELYLVGQWIALISTLGFTGIYAFRVAQEARLLAEALAETELVLTREQHLSQLDGLAAAAAHALGTPLGTITLVVKELARELPADSPYADDIQLLRTQAERCRDILRKISTLATDEEPHFQRMPLSHLIDEVAEPLRDSGIAIDVRLSGDGAEPVGRRDPAILYGLGNLLENAVDFARETVTIDARWTGSEVMVTITDDGPGFDPAVIERLGEPYVSKRGQRPEGGQSGGGLGLGFFIAKTLLRRSGAQLRFANRDDGARGARIGLIWKRPTFEIEA
jgi:two-component system sensor histidine kinase RegB